LCGETKQNTSIVTKANMGNKKDEPQHVQSIYKMRGQQHLCFFLFSLSQVLGFGFAAVEKSRSFTLFQISVVNILSDDLD
jgi:hypothetical protein